ncbi:MAG: hypothetical protein LBL84_01670 [Candidatus Nomurabacteria bacterium]|jgi:hypothetical protein|nr:hypothetical protein [Candidatus Nomurabacteria bacterium]
MILKRKNNGSPRRRGETRLTAESAGAAFRRNQTLNSYRGKSLDEDSARKHTHELNKLRRRIAAAFAVVAVLCGLVLFILWQFTASVEVSARIGGKAVEFGDHARVYTEAINKYYAQNPFERLRFLQRTDGLMEFLRQSAPEISELRSLEPSGLPSKLVLNVELRQPVAEWSQDGKVFYVDGTGRSFEHNYYERPALSIVDENELGAQYKSTAIASNRFLQTVGQLVTELGGRQLTVEKLIIPRGMVHEIDVLVKGSGIRFKLSVDRSPAEQAEDVARVLKYLSERGESPSYVDLRVEQKAYYK